MKSLDHRICVRDYPQAHERFFARANDAIFLKFCRARVRCGHTCNFHLALAILADTKQRKTCRPQPQRTLFNRLPQFLRKKCEDLHANIIPSI